MLSLGNKISEAYWCVFVTESRKKKKNAKKDILKDMVIILSTKKASKCVVMEISKGRLQNQGGCHVPSINPRAFAPLSQ